MNVEKPSSERPMTRQEVMQHAIDKDPCPASWGHCVGHTVKPGEAGVYFGKPTSTPHVCKGGRNHPNRLHLCKNCGAYGHQNRPLPNTNRGRYLASLLAKQEAGAPASDLEAPENG